MKDRNDVLNVTLKSHREFLRANGGQQKLFVALKLLPSLDAANTRPVVNLAIVIDTSGSMREAAPGFPVENTPVAPFVLDGKTYNATFRGQTKLGVAIEAGRRLIESNLLGPTDLISIIQFDDNSQVIASGEAGNDHQQLLDGISRLGAYSGGTRMARGMTNAENQLRGIQGARKVLLLTDGQTVDEDDCRRVAAALAELGAPVVALGIGEEYNEDLLADICNVTQGRPYDLRDLSTLGSVFEDELGSATRQVVSDVQVSIRTVRDIHVASVWRVYPNLSEVDVARDPMLFGNVESGDHTIFILELDLPDRPPVRARVAQIGLTYLLAAQGYRSEVKPMDLVVEFTSDEALAAQVDPEVLGYVQQRNVDNLVRVATEQARKDPQQAAKTLQMARSMTQRLGNHAMTVALGNAEQELQMRGTISAGTAKTIKVGSRTQTMKVGGPNDQVTNIPSEDEIRRLTGA
jgi:Ca-activated chloride channel family protein